MSLLGTDQPGNLIVGKLACRQWIERGPAGQLARDAPLAVDATVPQRHEGMAACAMAQCLVGSSAGGECPKFKTVRRLPDGLVGHVLVKFSGSDDTPGTQRWPALLVCEHVARPVLSTHLGIRAAASRIHRFGGRTTARRA
jgi:hypothetical protein